MNDSYDAFAKRFHFVRCRHFQFNHSDIEELAQRRANECMETICSNCGESYQIMKNNYLNYYKSRHS